VCVLTTNRAMNTDARRIKMHYYLFCAVCNVVKSDIGKEDDRSCIEDSLGAIRGKRDQICRGSLGKAKGEDEEDAAEVHEADT
jgi:hypothetical protein